MSEFVFDDGRKAEKVENTIDPMTKVIEVYVEPKPEKKLAQRIIEKFCVCEREIQTIDELTGEVVGSSVEKVCDGQSSSKNEVSAMMEQIEEKVGKKNGVGIYVLIGAILVQLVVLAYFVLA